MQLLICDLSKTYPNGTRALADVSLDVPTGMFGLLGRNGAGKSTLMGIIATLQEPDEGSVRLGELDVLREKGEVRKTLGYLPQSFGFHPKARAERLLEHFAVLKGIGERGVRRDVVESLLRQTNLTVTPDSLQPLLTDWFETITLWDVRTDRAVVVPTGTGEYVVTLDVVARKMRADGKGNETEVPMDDLVEIGVFAPARAGAPGEPLHLQRHRIRSGEQTIRITVPREPGRAGIDPYGKLIDRERGDNVEAVEVEG